MKYLSHPRLKTVFGTIGVATFENTKNLKVNIVKVENGFDVATVTLADPDAQYRTVLVKGTPVTIYAKDQNETAWTTEFAGKVRYRTEVLSDAGEQLVAKCDGAGYGFAETVVGQEYGAQSDNPTLDTMKEIITDATKGIGPKYVEKILGGATATGYDYDYSLVDTIAGTIPYLYLPFKPCSKALCDLIDLVQAIKGLSAGPHWLITPDNYLLVTPVGNHSADAISKGWTTYINGSVSAATFKQGRDFQTINLEDLEEAANYILYYANCIYPVNKDRWTESASGDWDTDLPADVNIGDSAVQFQVGANSICSTQNNNTGPHHIWYKDTVDLGLDLTALGGKYSIPAMNFLHRHDSDYIIGSGIGIFLLKSITDFTTLDVDGFYLGLPVGNDDKWTQYNIPVGPYWKHANNSSLMNSPFGGWLEIGTGDWADINIVAFAFDSDGLPAQNYIDGLHFAGWVLRGAYDSGLISSDKLKLKVINDPFAKYDTLLATDDSGTVAQLAKAELYRQRTRPLIASWKTLFVKDALPGQFAHLHARYGKATSSHLVDKDVRVTKLVHDISEAGSHTTWEATDDLINAMARASWMSLNEVLGATRPEFQDRQSSGTKLRDIDITAQILAKDYTGI